MDLGIEGRVALVGASGRGLGLATAQLLAAEGCHVAISDRDQDVLSEAEQSVRSVRADVRVMACSADLSQAEAITDLAENVRATLGPIDILITNSGGPPAGLFDDADDAKWEAAFQLTFLSAARLIRCVLPEMRERHWGRIVNFTSRALKEPIPNLIISNAVRLAVGGMAKTLAAEVAPYGITVNNLLPGPTATDRQMELVRIQAQRASVSDDEMLREIVRQIPMGRLARPDEQAAAAVFLASEAASYITGVSLLVDGGAVRAL